MNQKNTKRLRKTLPPKSTANNWRNLKRAYNETPRPERARLLDVQEKLSAAFTPTK